MGNSKAYVELLRTQYKNCIDITELRNITNSNLDASISAIEVGDITLSRLQTNFGYLAHNPGAKRFEETLCFTFLDQGSAIASQNGRTESLNQSNVLIYSNTRSADWSFNTGFSEFVIQIPARVIAKSFPAVTNLIGHVFPRTANTRTLLQFVQTYLAAPSASENTPEAKRAVSAMFESLLLIELESFCKRNNLSVDTDAHASALAYRIRSYIAEHIADNELTAEKIAQANHISVRLLYDVFATQGKPVMEYLWNTRLEMARQQLSDPRLTNISVSEIAYRCGFKSVSHFSKRFKKSFNMTPLDMRRTANDVSVSWTNSDNRSDGFKSACVI